MIIYEWQYHCATEDSWITELRKDTEGTPTQCKNNAAHSLTADSTSIIAKHGDDIQQVRINRTDLLDADSVYTIEEGWELIIKSGDTVSYKEEAFPYDVDLITGYIRRVDVNVGDTFDSYGTPYTTSEIGVVNATASAGDTVITFDTTAYDEVRVGRRVGFKNSTLCFYIIDKDDGTKQVTLSQTIPFDLAVDDAVKWMVPQYIGAIASNAAQGANSVVVNETAFAYCRRGYYLKFPGDDHSYRIISTDSETNTVGICPCLYNARSTNDYIYLRQYFVKNFWVNGGNYRIPMAADVEDATGFTAGNMICCEYTHGSTPASDDTCHMWLVYRY